MKARRQLTRRQQLFGALLRDQVSFMRCFFADDLVLEPSTRQKLFWNDVSRKVLLATGRKTGKTLNIEARIIRKSLAYRNRQAISERMFAAPGENQILPTISRLLSKIEINPLFRVLRVGWNKNDGILKWRTNVVWHIRIDGTAGDDRNMVGLRLQEIIYDEAAFTVRPCHSSRKQSALPNCEWLYAGVPNSVRHTPFWELDQSAAIGRSWSHHKTSTYVNPLYWQPGQHENLMDEYGKGSSDYTTQVMGQWGAEMYSSFPRDAIAVDETQPYRVVTLKSEDLPRSIQIDLVEMTRLAAKIQLPKCKGAQYVIGGDYGYLQDPAEFGVLYRESLDAHVWRLLARIEVLGVDPLTQAVLIDMLVNAVGREQVGCVCLDLASAGLAISLELTKPGSSFETAWYEQAIMNLNSGGLTELPDPRDPNKKIKVKTLQAVTQQLQAAFIAARADLKGRVQVWLGDDDQIVQELVDTREQKTPAGHIIYIPRGYASHRPTDHCTDMLRCLVAGAHWAMTNQLEVEQSKQKEKGWVKNPFRSEWKPAWLNRQRVRLG